MTTLTLRAVTTVDFRASELTNYLRWRKEHRGLAESLRKGDAVLLVSVKGDQMVFIYGFLAIRDEHGSERTVLRSERHRLTSGRSFSAYMLAEYAEAAGLKLLGTPTFAEHFRLGFGKNYIDAVLAERALRSVAA